MLDYYTGLLADHERIEAFRGAIHDAVRPDDVVVELGCGVGTYSILAARAGARRVFGVDSNPVIEFARQVARQNGVDVEFFESDARDVALPEPATLLIFEDYSSGLIGGTTRALLQEVRPRWMAGDFRVLPERASLHVAPMESALARSAAFPLDGLGRRPFGLDLQVLRDAEENTVVDLRGPSDARLLGPPQRLLDQSLQCDLPPSLSCKGRLEIAEKGSFDGLCLWFDLHLDSKRSYSNRPDGAGVWGQLFFPVPERWEVGSGDELDYAIRFESASSSGLWAWSVERRGNLAAGSKRFSGNNFAATSLTPKSLRTLDSGSAVRLTERAQQEALVLRLADGTRSMAQICEELRRRIDGLDEVQARNLVGRHLGRTRRL